MDDNMKDRWLYPMLTGVIAGAITGIPLMIWGAWYSGVKWHSPFSMYWFRLVFAAPVPVWFAFPLAILAVFSIWKAYNFRQRNTYLESREKQNGLWETVTHVLKQDKAKLERRIEELEKKATKLHGVWNQSQAFWHMGRHGNVPSMQVGGWIDLTTSNTKDTLYLLAGYIDGHRSQIFTDVEIKPNVVNRCLVMLFINPPLENDPTKIFESTIVVEDQLNRKYELPRQSFRATPIRTPFPVPAMPIPELHIAWRVSGWCWAMHEGERVIRISGDAPIQLDNATGKVLLTSVRIEGAEFVGIFDQFRLEPGVPVFRGMNLNFKGIKPEGRSPLTASLIFLDIRGNEYSTKSVAFRPLSEPERVGGLRW